MAKGLMKMGEGLMNYFIKHGRTFCYYGKVELVPPKISELPLIVKQLSSLIHSAKSGAWQNVTMKQAFLNTLVAVEVGSWFFIGECIGRRHIIGYKLNKRF